MQDNGTVRLIMFIIKLPAPAGTVTQIRSAICPQRVRTKGVMNTGGPESELWDQVETGSAYIHFFFFFPSQNTDLENKRTH